MGNYLLNPRIKECVDRLFDELQNQRTPYVVLYKYEDLPEKAGHDIDVLAPSRAIREIEDSFLKISKELNLFVTRRYGRANRNLTIEAYDLFHAAESEGRPRIAIHAKAFSTYRFGRLIPSLVWSQDVVAQRSYHGKVSILDARWEFVLVLAHWLEKYGDTVNKSHSHRLLRLSADPGVCSFLQEALTPSEFDRLTTCLEEGTHAGAVGIVTRLVSAVGLPIGLRTGLRHPIELLRAFSTWVIDKHRRVGLGISFCGADGVGKSTLAAEVRRLAPPLLASENSRVVVWHVREDMTPTRTNRVLSMLRQGGKRLIKSLEPPDNETVNPVTYVDYPKSGYPWRIRQLLGLIVDLVQFAWSWHIKIGKQLRCKKVVLLDRSGYDLFVYRPRFRLLEWAVVRFLPKPDWVVLLRASPQTIMDRKAELTIDKIEDYYSRIGELLDAANVRVREVDADVDLDSLAGSILGQIVREIDYRLRSSN